MDGLGEETAATTADTMAPQTGWMLRLLLAASIAAATAVGAVAATVGTAGAQAACSGIAAVAEVDTTEKPLGGMRIEILPPLGAGSDTPVTTTVTDPAGNFCIDVADGDYRLRAVLVNDDDHWFSIEREIAPSSGPFDRSNPPAIEPVWIEHDITEDDFDTFSGASMVFFVGAENAFGDERQSRSNLEKSGRFSDLRGADLRDVAANFYQRTHQYLSWWSVVFDPPLDARPVSVVVDNHRHSGNPDRLTFYSPTTVRAMMGGNRAQMSSFAPTPGWPAANPDVLWHELTHHLQEFGLLNQRAGATPGARVNHAGWENGSTADSLIEGMAVFFPTVAPHEGGAIIDDQQTDDIWAWGVPLERNKWKTWSAPGGVQREDFAFAALLWDLWDSCGPFPCETTVLGVRPNKADPADDVAATVTDDVSLSLDTIYNAILTITDPAGADDDLTVAGLHDSLYASAAVPNELKDVPTHGVDLDSDGTRDISRLDVAFLTHGFYPCEYQGSNPHCFYVIGEPIGRTDHEPGSGPLGLEERRIGVEIPGAAIRVENPTAATQTVNLDLDDDGEIVPFGFDIPAGATIDLPLELPPHYSFPLQPGASPPSCGDPLADALVGVSMLDGPGGSLAFDSCQDANAIGFSGGAPAARYVVGEDAVRFLIQLAASGEAGAIDFLGPFSQVLSDLDAAGIPVLTTPPGETVDAPSIDTLVKLAIPGLEALAGDVIPGVGLKVFPDEDAIEIDGQIAIGSEVLDIFVRADWDETAADPLLEIPAIDVSLDLAGAEGDTLIDAGEIAALIEQLFPGLTIDASALPFDLALDSVGIDFSWNDGAVTFDGTARAIFGDLGVGLLLSADSTPTTPAKFLLGVRFDNATDPDSDFIQLGGLLDGAIGELAADLELPEFSLATVLPPGANVTGADLRDRQRNFFGGDIPDTLQLDSSLSLAADFNVGSLGPDVLDVFGWNASDVVTLSGKLGFTLGDLESGVLDLSSVELNASLPGVSGADSPLLPNWLTVGDVTLGVNWSDAGQIVATVAADVDAILGGDTIRAALGGELTLESGRLATTLSAELVGEVQGDGTVAPGWGSPFDVDWLRIEEAAFMLDFAAVDDGTGNVELQASANLSGTAGIGPEANAGTPNPVATVLVMVELALDDDASANVTVELVDGVTVGDVLSAVAPDLLSPSVGLPDQLKNAGLDAGTSLTVSVSPAGLEMDAVINASFALFGDPISFSALVHASFPANGDPNLAFGIRPTSEITLGDMLPIELPEIDLDGLPEDDDTPEDNQPPVPLDFTLVKPDESDFGFVFAVLPGGSPISVASLPQPTQDWFAPLFGGGDLTNRFVGDGFSTLGSFGLPEPLGEIVAAFGFDRKVLASGRLPLPGQDGVSLDLGLSLEVDPELLGEIDFVDSLALDLGLSAVGNATDGFRLDVSMGAVGTLRFLQGVDPQLTDALAEDPLNLDFSSIAAQPVAEGEECPRGGVNSVGPNDTRYCYDIIDADVHGVLSFAPPVVSVALEGGINPRIPDELKDDPTAGWAPLGFTDVVIRELNGRLELGFNPINQPTPISIKVGASANLTLFGKNAAGAIQVGADVGVTPSAPPVPTIKPNFDGFRVALPTGISKGELADLYRAFAVALNADPDAIGANELDALPNVGVRDLLFSVAIGDVDRLCLTPGIALTGTLYVYNENLPANTAFPPCDPDTGELEFPEVSCLDPAPDDPTIKRKDQGCMASMEFFLTPAGLSARGSAAAFDFDPLPFEFTDDLEAVLKLTPSKQTIRLAGAVRAGGRGPDFTGPIVDEWASGSLGLELGLTEMTFAGHFNVLGFNALLDARVGASSEPGEGLFEVLTGKFDPSLDLHVVLAAPELADPSFAGEPDFADVVSGFATPLLSELEDIVVFLDDVIADFRSDPAGTLLGLPQRMEDAGYGDYVPDWLVVFANEWNDFLGDSSEYDLSEYGLVELFEAVLADLDIDGVPGTYVPAEDTCRNTVALGIVEGTVIDGECWSITAVDLEGVEYGVVPGLWVYATCTGVEDDAGNCWAIPPIHIDGICSVVFPSIADGGCTLEEIIGLLDEGFTEVVEAALPDVSGFSVDFLALIDEVRSWLDPAPGTNAGPLFSLSCAEIRLESGVFDGVTTLAALDADAFGVPLDFALEWSFDPANLLAITGDNVNEMLWAFWDLVTATTEPPQSECGGPDPGIDPDLYEAVGGEAFELPDGVVPTNPPPPPPPPVVSVSVAPKTADEGTEVTATVAFDRELTDDDGARDVVVDWGDGSPTDTVNVGVGSQSSAVPHVYADDDPTGTSSDVYTVAVDDPTDPGEVDATAAITVRNAAPVVSATPVAPAVDENGVATVMVEWNDVAADTHDVVIDWGDGSRTTAADASSGSSFEHTYLDDDPTATGHDDVTVRVAVTDDDKGVGRTEAVVTVANVAPDAGNLDLAPQVVDEGDLVEFTIDFSDVGTLDTHIVEVEFDDSESATDPETFDPDVTRKTKLGDRSTTVSFRYLDDDPTATPQDDVVARIRVTDDDGGIAEVTQTITIRNAAPLVCATVDPDGFPEPDVAVPGEACPEPTELSIDEGDTAMLTVAFADPGVLDTHTAVVDWGDDSIPDTVLDADDLAEGSFTLEQAYGDNGTFPVGVVVTDDDTGQSGEDLGVVVENVDPSAVIDDTGTVLGDGTGDDGDGVGDDDGVLDVPTVLTRSGDDADFSARATDPGSDDLSFLWDWDASDRFDTSFTETAYLVNPPDADPLPSPSLQPRDVVDATSHAWSQACLYEVGLTVTDDDAGVGSDGTWVVVTGTDHRLRKPGWWYNQYDFDRNRNRNDISDDTATCYLEIVRHMSRVFDTFRDASTYELAMGVLNTKQTSNEDEIMVRQLLAAWMNFANGSIGWNDLVDTDGDRTADTPFNEVMAGSEDLRLDPTATRAELLAQEDVLENVNGG